MCVCVCWGGGGEEEEEEKTRRKKETALGCFLNTATFALSRVPEILMLGFTFAGVYRSILLHPSGKEIINFGQAANSAAMLCAGNGGIQQTVHLVLYSSTQAEFYQLIKNYYF